METSKKISVREFNSILEAYLQAEAHLQAHPWSYEESAAHDAAKERMNSARDVLNTALRGLPHWGAHGSVFVTRRCDRIGGTEFNVVIHVNSVPRVFASSTWGQRKLWLDKVLTLEEGLALRAEEKRRRVERREADAAYQAARHALQHDLLEAWHACLASFGQWEYCPGQKGGYFYSHTWGAVAALPALKKVWGDDWDTVPSINSTTAHLEREWDRKILGCKF